jgi:hypothetical protein
MSELKCAGVTLLRVQVSRAMTAEVKYGIKNPYITIPLSHGLEILKDYEKTKHAKRRSKRKIQAIIRQLTKKNKREFGKRDLTKVIELATQLNNL